MSNEPERARTSIPCRNHAHQRCVLPDCICECHDPADDDDEPEVVGPERRATGTQKGTTKHLPEIGLVWEEPPSQYARRSPYEMMAPLMDELRAHPGDWARLAVYRSANSAATAGTKIRTMYPDIEFAARRLDDGGSALYGRSPKP